MAGPRTFWGVLTSLAAVSAAATATATTFEVGPAHAYANIDDVPLSSLGPGDVVLIHWRETPYYERFGIDTAGTATDPIVVRGVPNGQRQLPVLDATGSSGGYNSHTRGIIHVSGGASYVVVENLELRNANVAGGLSDNSAGVFAPGGSHLTFRNLHIHHSGNGLFSWVDSSDVLVEGCYIHDNGNVGSLYEHNIYTESDGENVQQGRCIYKRAKWQLVALGAGEYELRSYLTGACADVADGSTADGANLQQRACGLGDSQRFWLVPAT